MDYNTNNTQTPYGQTVNNQQANYSAGTRCPGKEITGMVLGINAIVWSGLAMFFCWMISMALVYGLVGIGCGIAAMVLHSKVMEQATIITNKIHTGKKLGLAGIIVGGVAIVVSIIVLVVLISLGLGAAIFR